MEDEGTAVRCRTSLVREEDLLAETLAQFSSPIILSPREPENPSEQPTDEEVGNDTIKVEPDDEKYLCNLYPELTLNETEIDFPPPSVQILIKHDVGQDWENFTSPYISNKLLNSLIVQFEGKLSSDIVCRSVSCFVPVVRLENQDSLTGICGKKAPRNRKILKTGRRLKIKNSKKRIANIPRRRKLKAIIRKRTPKGIKEESEVPKKVKVEQSPKKEKKNFACAECSKEFRTEAALLNHQKSPENGGEGASCLECDRVFQNLNCLRYHSRKLHGRVESGVDAEKVRRSEPKSRVCEICNKTFTRVAGLRLHRRTVHSLGKTVGKRRKLKNEGQEVEDSAQEKEKGPKGHPCSYCTKIFIHASVKYRHELSHTGEKPFLCVICGKGYKSCGALREHENTTHTNTLDLLCTICGAAFGRQTGLKYHIIAKHGEKKFKCEEEGCGRHFVQKATLKRHIRRVHSKGLHQCHLCHRVLQSKEILDKHLKSHELRKLKADGVGPPKIGTSPHPRKRKRPDPNAPKIVRVKKPFVPKPRKARTTPAPDRKLQCPHCEKRFPYQNEIDKHVKAMHTGEREFKCPEEGCPKAYISHYKLQNHLRSAHGHVIANNLLADVACDECGKVVQGIARLAIHKNCRHSVGGSKQVRTSATSLTNTPRRSRTSKSGRGKNSSPVESEEEDDNVRIMDMSAPTMASRQGQASIPPIVQSQLQAPPQVAHSTQQQRTMGGFQEHHHHVVHPVPSIQDEFFNFHPYPTPLQPSNFPYSTPTNFIHQAPPHFQQAQAQTDFQNGFNFWNTDQIQNQVPRHPDQTHLLPQSHQMVPNPPQRPVLGGVVEYARSDYNNGIQMIPQEEENVYEENAATFGDDPDYSESSPDEESEPEVVVPPPRKRGRPRKSEAGAPSTPKEKPSPKRRSSSTPKQRKVASHKHLPCRICGTEFDTNQHLQNHYKSHARKERRKEFADGCKCETCGKVFALPYHLLVHSVIHDPTIRPFKCKEPECEEKFQSARELRRHLDHHSLKAEKKYRCKICKEQKENSKDLYEHIKTIHADRMHTCEESGCSFTCPTLSRLKRHAEQHQKKEERVRPYKCTLCDCSYYRGHNLTQHMDTAHRGAAKATRNPDIPSFPCDICHKAFEFDWKLMSHRQKIHGGKRRRLGLDQCGIGNKQLFYYCEDCDWSFDDARHLRIHKKTRHQGDPVGCFKKPCDKKYYYVNTLENHIRSQHEALTPEDEELLMELRKTYPNQGPPEEEEEVRVDKRKGRRKRRNPRKQALPPFIEETYDDGNEDVEEIVIVKIEEMKQLPKRNSQRVRKRKTYVEYDDDEEDEGEME